MKRLFLFGMIFVAVACGEEGPGGGPNSNTAVGVSVGNPSDSNPSTKTKSVTLNFKTVTQQDGSLGETAQAEPGKTETDPTSPLCRVISDTGVKTQECKVTPENFNMGILAVYLLDCGDEAGNSIPCGDDDKVVSIKNRYTLYVGDQVDYIVSEEGNPFPAQLTLEIDDSITVGGVQLVTSYIEQKFPSMETNPENAAMLTEELQGRTYRLCRTPTHGMDPAIASQRCGHQARFGDVLFDLGDGLEYIDTREMTENKVLITVDERPENYGLFSQMDWIRKKLGEFELTTSDYFELEGYFAPILSLDATMKVEPDKDTKIDIALNIGRTFVFFDGFSGTDPVSNVCVQAVSDTPCNRDADPFTPGKYDPRADTVFYFLMPTIDLDLTQS